MVEVPLLPGINISKPSLPRIEIKTVIKMAHRERISNINKVYSLLDKLTAEQKAELYVWLAEQPIPSVDPVRLAMAAFYSLQEDELPSYFEQLKKGLDLDLWKLLTED